MKPMNARRMVLCALLTAIALTIFMVEAQIPPLVPVPGVKLGLANIVTVYSMFVLGPGDTLLILLARIFLGALFSGRTIFYSLAGGMSCYLIMLLLRKILTVKQLWVCGAISSIFHNIGQIIAAIVINMTHLVILYLPLMIIPGIIAGTFTGFAAQFLVDRLDGKIKL